MAIHFHKTSAFEEIRSQIEQHLFDSVLELEKNVDSALHSVDQFSASIDRLMDTLEQMYKTPNSKDHLVKEYLESAGATPAKSKEVQEYVDKVLKFDAEFSEKSKADKTVKSGKPRKIKKLPEGGHWITLDGKHIFIEDK